MDPVPITEFGAGESPIHDVRDAVRLSDGSVWIGMGAPSVQRFDSTGRHLGPVGGLGDGPGEFRIVASVSLIRSTDREDGASSGPTAPSDTVLILDPRRRVAVLFSAAGAFVGEVRLPEQVYLRRVEASRHGQLVAEHRIDDSGVYTASVPAEETAALHRRRMLVARVDRSGASFDTIAVVPGDEIVRTIRSGVDARGVTRTAVSVSAPPLPRTSFWSVFGDRVFVGSTDWTGFDVFDLDGRRVKRVRVPSLTVPLTRERLDSLREGYVERGSEGAPTSREERRTLWGNREFPATLPVFSGIQSDEGGNIWMAPYRALTPRETGDSVAGWAVFDPEGSYLGNVEIPTRYTIHQIDSDRLLVSWRDELDVEHIGLLALERWP